ncbi:hypothetical protein AD948_12785 [Acetobacter senegalensis]|uniref:Uncharacterized protein n=1 Tax=Acetobacter senegalensis TaxID=446692 RepID=A0A149TY42_9PROT|nr:hypothetical protein AD948_12785 [Acetobacter senegalensis]
MLRTPFRGRRTREEPQYFSARSFNPAHMRTMLFITLFSARTIRLYLRKERNIFRNNQMLVD